MWLWLWCTVTCKQIGVSQWIVPITKQWLGYPVCVSVREDNCKYFSLECAAFIVCFCMSFGVLYKGQIMFRRLQKYHQSQPRQVSCLWNHTVIKGKMQKSKIKVECPSSSHVLSISLLYADKTTGYHYLLWWMDMEFSDIMLVLLSLSLSLSHPSEIFETKACHFTNAFTFIISEFRSLHSSKSDYFQMWILFRSEF